MANLNDFSRRIRKRANEIGSNLTKAVRRVAITADAAVVMETPVDTGRAKSNWIVRMNSPSTDTIEPYAPGEGGTTAVANRDAAIAQAEAVIATFEAGKDMEIYISNNLEYIGELNDGSSAQAPENFVEIAVQEAVAAARRARI